MPYVLNRKTPQGIDTVVRVKAKQRELGVEPDGVWGPVTEAAYQRSLAGDTHAPQPLTMAGLKLAEQAQETQTPKGPTYEGKTGIESRLMDMDALKEDSAHAQAIRDIRTQQDRSGEGKLSDMIRAHNEQKLAAADTEYQPGKPRYRTAQASTNTAQQPLTMAGLKQGEMTNQETAVQEHLIRILEELYGRQIGETDDRTARTHSTGILMPAKAMPTFAKQLSENRAQNYGQIMDPIRQSHNEQLQEADEKAWAPSDDPSEVADPSSLFPPKVKRGPSAYTSTPTLSTLKQR